MSHVENQLPTLPEAALAPIGAAEKEAAVLSLRVGVPVAALPAVVAPAEPELNWDILLDLECGAVCDLLRGFVP